MTDELEPPAQDDRRRAQDQPDLSSATPKRAYVAPELVEYGTVAKLTQSGGWSRYDYGGMRRR